MKPVNVSAPMAIRWTWLNRAAIIGFLLLFRLAVMRADAPMQLVLAALIIANAWCHWKGKAPNGG